MNISKFKKLFSLAAKFNFLTILLILITSVGVSLFIIKVEANSYYQDLLNHGRAIADMASKNCEFGIYTEDRRSLLQVVNSLSADSDVAYIIVMNQKKNTLVSNVFKESVQAPRTLFKNIDHVTEIVHEEFINEQDGHRYIELLVPVLSVTTIVITDPLLQVDNIKKESKSIGYLRLGLSQEGLRKRIHQLIVAASFFTIIVVLVGSGLTIFMTKRITLPLKSLKTATHDISEGKFDSYIKISTRDEISDLANSFNHMLDHLRSYRSQVEERTSELTAANKQLTQEINERIQAEKSLKESEERYALAARGANDGLWDWNLKTNEIYFSYRWKSMLGFEDKEIRNNPYEWFNRVHPYDIRRVKREIDAHLKGITPFFESEYRILHKDGNYRVMLCRGLAVKEDGGEIYRMAGSQTDITARKVAEEQLLHDALHDALTGLPNRALFIDRLTHIIEVTKRREDYFFAILFIDLDQFKIINDSLGHIIGDQLLIAFGKRLLKCIRPSDTIARLGGDEFVILLEDIKDVSNATFICERIQEKLATPFDLAGQEVFTTASIGIAVSLKSYDRPEQLLRDADIAMYHAKMRGRANYVIFEPSMHEEAVERLQIDTDLRRAVERNEFIPYYQPILSLKTNSIIGYEALVRWRHPVRGIVYPQDFIKIAEETGIIVSIDRLVLREACRQLREWQMQFPEKSLRFISVNLSNKQLAQPDLVEYISQILNETGLDPRCLKLEITENVVIENPEYISKIFSKIRKLGIQLYIDDFGTGYSSLSYIHQLPIDGLKIDRSFIQRIGENGEKQKIIQTILMLAHNMKFDVIAEGVETEIQLEHIEALECEYWQGYLFSKPVEHDQASALLSIKPLKKDMSQ